MDLGELPLTEREILRYAFLPSDQAARVQLPLAECTALFRGKVHCRAVWSLYPVTLRDSAVDLTFAVTGSASLGEHLKGCGSVLLTACTAGFEMDALIAKASLKGPLYGLIMHAIGAAEVEKACDTLCEALRERFQRYTLTGRFSPGYGDLPLIFQRDIFTALQCEKTVGITLTDSCLMKPSKSVTALIGMKEK